jgi:uncharacterized protein (DUF1697 family)
MRYVAFLRGMNLGGRRIRNEELKQRFGALGLGEVACFRASGNVVFATEKADEARLTRQIEDGLGGSLGYEVPVFLRDAEELRAIVAHEPFDPDVVEASQGKLQVSLLKKKPSAPVRRKVLALSTDADRLALEGRELYWLPSGGMLESTLDLDAIDTLLGLSTRRTKGTVEQLAYRYFTD